MNTISTKWLSRGLVLLALFTLSACSTFDVVTPSNMVSVEKSKREYVAMTHDGVILRALVHKQGRGKDVGRASLDFWVNSVTERMRTRGGYALLAQSEVKSSNGVPGAHLQFGRDQAGVTHLYTVTIFVTKKNIHIIDAGGTKELFDATKSSVEGALKSYNVKR